MVHDSGRLDTLIKPLKSCISPPDANKNILPLRDTSRCSREAWENLLKCHKIVTLDSSSQSVSITVPLRESADGFDIPICSGVQSPRLYFGDFFCARLAWLPMVAGQGHLRVCRCLSSGMSTLFGPPPRLTSGMAGNKCNSGVPMLKLSRGMPVPCFPWLFDSTDHVFCFDPALGGMRCL